MNALIIVADLGNLRAYRQTVDAYTQSKSLDLLEDVANPDAHLRFGETVTDQAGRFPSGGPTASGGMSHGENHQTESENQKRRIRFIADQINRIVGRESALPWNFAAPQQSNRAILGQVRSDLRERLRKNLPVDLTKAAQKELMERFS